ncbi:hypothetical protein [Streptomyces sp. NPDC021020]|uniref:hypothetical protein n=1 Tax=Streptomyces sp. NPDC021020 TaxID=3365109 RepID=UPI0037BA68C6
MEDGALPLPEPSGPSVDVVVMHQVPGTTAAVPHGGGHRVDLGQLGPLSQDVVNMLRDSMISLQAGGDVPPAVIEELKGLPVPELFRGSPWLRRARALVLMDGRARVAGAAVGYRAGLGLWVAEDTVSDGA